MKGLVLACLLLAGTAAGADFDYYTFAVGLTPAFCDLNPNWRESLQCRDRPPLSVHGLWPGKNAGRAPESCPGAALELPPALEKDLRGVMPDAGLRRHEWERHGRCSGLSAAAYFDFIAREFVYLRWPPLLQPQGRDALVERQAVLDAFRRLNPSFPERSIMLRCEGRDRPPLLTEIRLCLSPQGRPVECGAGVRPDCPVVVRIRAR